MRPARTSLLITVAAGLLAAPAAAQQVSFVAALDRDAVNPGDTFTYEVTLTFANEQVGSYQPPDFKGLTLVQAPQFPNRSTQMQFGGGQNLIQNSFSWRYVLGAPAGGKNTITIGPARVTVNGRELRSNPVPVHLLGTGGASGGGAGASASAPAGAAAPPPSADLSSSSSEAAEARGGNFVRAVPSKTRAFVGEQVVVAWYIYLAQRQDKYQPLADAHTDGFWSEDLSTGNPAGRLSFSQDTIGGRPYMVGTLLKKALFPLRAGKLTITPLEMEVSQVDFFGGALRTQRLKAQPLVIEALPLPREGQPPGFPPGNVGHYTFAVRADRDKVSIGEAVTVTVEIKGEGNLRNVQPPALPTPAGWKSYEPKTNVNIDPGDTVSGSKTVEYLLLPEHAGTTTIPALELATFDPRTKAYAVLKSEPLRLEVAGDATAGASGGATPGGGAGATAAGAGGPVENVIAAEIRPIHGRSRLSRDAGATFLHSTPFLAVLVVPPLALGLTALAERLRERLAAESRRTRRRRVRSLARKRLGAAEAHREAGRTADFYIEIDRVLREALSTRLGRAVGGLRMDELDELLRARGMPPGEAARIVAELEACDQARFAPAAADDGGGGASDGAAASMSSALERAGELIVAIQRAPLHEEARA